MTWDKLAIGDFCRTGSGGTPSRKKASRYFGGNIPWVKSGELREGVITKTEEKITELAMIESSAKFIPKGALLVAMYGATIGRVARLGIDATSNQAVCHILPDESLVDMQYMFHALQAQVPHWLGKGVGGAQSNISQEIIRNTVLPLPPLEEQRRIAAILDKASRIAELCGTALKLSHAADKSLFLHFFADLPEESDLLLEELADKRSNAIRTGPFGSQLLHGEFTDSGVAVLGIDNAVNNSFEWSKRRFISHEKYEQLKRYTVYPGDLLITIMGTCGRAAVVPDDIPQAINTKHLCAISVDGSVVLPEYLHSYILFHPSASRYLSKRTKGAIMEGLNMTIIKELPVTVPPMSHQIAWLARRKILRSVAKRAQTMSASTLSLCQSFSYKLLEERGA
jgi:type I restriction enzyme S subunit